MMRPADIL